MREHELDFEEIGLSPDLVLGEIGYGKQEPGSETLALTELIFGEVSAITRPSYAFKLFEGRVNGPQVEFTDGTTLTVGPVIASLLKNSERFALFAATAGNAFQAYQDRLKSENDTIKSFIADTVGSCIAELAGDRMERFLEKELAGTPHTNRFSPGYCGWNLREQKELFRLLGGNPCDISLSESCLMTPIKSISGIIGIGRDVDTKKYGCQFCELETCYKKKQRIQNNG